MCKKNDILFLQPRFAHYRNQIFNNLSNDHDIHFVFESSSSTYPGEIIPAGFSFTFLARESEISCLKLIFYLLKNRPNIIISSVSYSYRSIVSYIYVRLFKKRLILWILEWQNRKSAKHTLKRHWRRLRSLLGAKVIRNSHSLVVGGAAAKNYALSLGKNEIDIFMAMQCTDDLKMNQTMQCEKIKHKKCNYTILYLSRIVQRKGLHILIEAFSLLRKNRSDVCLLIGGDGPFRQHCEKLAKNKSVSDISFVGPLNPQSVFHLYEQADLFILPSYCREGQEEPWGLVINEAMSMSLPIITTTAVGAAHDLVIDEYNGFVVKENDVRRLYKAMNRILEMDLIRMGMNSRILFEKKNNFTQMANGFTRAIEHAKAL